MLLSQVPNIREQYPCQIGVTMPLTRYPAMYLSRDQGYTPSAMAFGLVHMYGPLPRYVLEDHTPTP